MKNFEFSTLFGIITALFIIFLAIEINGTFWDFVDLASIAIVFASTIAIIIACFSLKEVLHSCLLISRMSVTAPENSQNLAMKFISISKFVSKQGLLELEKSGKYQMNEPLFQKGLELLVDNESIENIEKILLQQIMSMQEKYNVMISMIRKAGETSPSMGLIGTLIGLVQMLGSLDDVKAIGPAMAVALLTTFYGALMAYVIFFPLASKLESHAKFEFLNSHLFLQTILSISKQENPRKLESTLNSILPEDQRILFFKN